MNRKGLTMGSLSWAAVLPLLVLALVVLGLPSTLRAQVTATLSGTVEDQSGGVIPGAHVTLTNEATKFAYGGDDQRSGPLCVSVSDAGHI